MKPRGRALIALEKQKWLYDGYSPAPFSEALNWIVCSCPCSPAEELRFLLGWSLHLLRTLQTLGEDCLGFQPHHCLTFLLTTEWTVSTGNKTWNLFLKLSFLWSFYLDISMLLKLYWQILSPPPFTCVCPANARNVSYTFFFFFFFFWLNAIIFSLWYLWF